MKKLLFLLVFVMAVTGVKCAYCQDNILAVDKIDNKAKVQTQEDKTLPKEQNPIQAEAALEETKPADDTGDQDLENIRAYREVLENKQKELEVIKLDLEKSDLMLKKRQAEKEIFEIDKALPQGKGDVSSVQGGLMQSVKAPLVDPADVKIQLLVIADNLKEGQVSLKGSPYVFKEGDSIASKLTVEQIEPTGVTFKQVDGSLLKLNFVN
jgi:cell division protein FtsB